MNTPIQIYVGQNWDRCIISSSSLMQYSYASLRRIHFCFNLSILLFFYYRHYYLHTSAKDSIVHITIIIIILILYNIIIYVVVFINWCIHVNRTYSKSVSISFIHFTSIDIFSIMKLMPSFTLNMFLLRQNFPAIR